MQKRGHASPDDGDAPALTFASLAWGFGRAMSCNFVWATLIGRKLRSPFQGRADGKH
jgi:hypothetical protein